MSVDLASIITQLNQIISYRCQEIVYDEWAYKRRVKAFREALKKVRLELEAYKKEHEDNG